VADLKVLTKSANPKEGPRNKCSTNILAPFYKAALYTRVSEIRKWKIVHQNEGDAAKLIINHCSYTRIVFILGNYIEFYNQCLQ
jgi:hypothetical protein